MTTDDDGAGLATAAVSRRNFVRAAAVGSVLAGSGVAAGMFDALPAGAGGSLVATGPDLHLLRRATFGPTEELVKEIRRLGRNRWLDRQLHPASVNDGFCQDYVADRYPDLDMTRAARLRDPRGLVGPDVRARAGHDRAGHVEQAPAVRGDGRLLVEPPERHEPARGVLVVPARLRPHGDPQARAGQVQGHAAGLRDAPRDDDVPQQRGEHEGQPERELRPRDPRAALGRRRRRVRRGGHASVDPGADRVRHQLGDGRVRVPRLGPLHRAGRRDGVARRQQATRTRARTSASPT